MRIRCVLVGIDVYERPDIPPLTGCVNDVALVRATLKAFGVPNEDIRVVVNERATKANILHRLRRAVADAEPGDVVVFYFSGHGSQVRDRNGDELADSLDEIICPYDMDWDRKTFILDDDVDVILAETPTDVVVEAFVDCCFWGAGPGGQPAGPGDRVLDPDVRFIPPPFDIAARAEGDEDRLQLHSLAGCHCFEGQNVFWAASSEGQPAAEDYLEGRGYGVFTYWGCRFMVANAEQILNHEYSRQQLLADLHGYLRSHRYEQEPQLWAPWELQIAPPFLRGNPEVPAAETGSVAHGRHPEHPRV
jgi:metacaspase-1